MMSNIAVIKKKIKLIHCTFIFIQRNFLFFWHVGFQLPNQGSNPCALQWGVQSLNHWTTREVLNIAFKIFASPM